ncbi:C1orf27_2 [Blepharisma stoltei]|uniref:Uncharacterized protein n=1 Tax=Blepharisma stoltei TaxID=1481888 RepID=A0AAU9KBC2_9CILI|nr:unnamed protein product [Blepharisma stoltei]
MITDSKEFSTFLENLKGKSSAEIGLFIGYTNLEKSYIYMQANAPTIEISSHKNISPLLSCPLTVPETTYADWILEYAKQLSRVLPGGLEILGIFLVSEDDISLESFLGFPEGLLNLLVDLNSEVLEKDSLIVFHFAIQSQKTTAKIIDLKNKIISSPELKLATVPKLEEVRCFIKTSLEAAEEENSHIIIQQIIREWGNQLKNNVFSIDGQTKADIAIGSLKTEKNYHVAEIYSSAPGFCTNSNAPRIRVQGYIESRVLVHPKSTIKEAREVVIKDLLFSLKNRFEIISEEIPLQENPFLNTPVKFVSQLPRRAFFNLNNGCILSSYGTTSQDKDFIQAYATAISSAKLSYTESREFHLKVDSPLEIEKAEEKKDQIENMRFMIILAVIFAVLLVSFLIKAYR